jgi:hypothetical protein
MREKMRSTGRCVRGAGRDEAAGVGHQHDQRDLAHVGRLAAHVGAGDDSMRRLIVEAHAVGDEGLAPAQAADLLDHRVAAVAISMSGSSSARGATSPGLGALGQVAEHVQRGDGGGAGLQRGQDLGEPSPAVAS